MVDCVNDDSAACCGKCFKKHDVIAVIPVFGRGPLVKYTIERLYKKNRVRKVICIGHLPEDRKICEEVGAEWVQHSNKPLGQKWNAGFLAAKKYNPKACLFVGSSDWLSDNWLDVMMPKLDGLLGTLGCYFLDLGRTERLCHWPGYKGRREGETIGIGRIISREVLDEMQWKPFNDMLYRSLDSSMQQSVNKIAGITQAIDTKEAFSMSISTNQWGNLHRFEDHWNGILPSERIENVDNFIDKHFPEARKIFKTC